MKLLQLQKYLGFAGIAAALAFFYTDYLLETDEESFHIFPESSIALMQTSALLLMLLFFFSNALFVNRRLHHRAYKKPLMILLISGVLSLVLPCMLFFEWLWKMLKPKKDPSLMDDIARSLAAPIFKPTQRIESLQNIANILFILLSILMLMVLLLAIVNASKKKLPQSAAGNK